MFQFNEPLAVIWDEGDERNWYIEFYFYDEDGAFRVDHLKKNNNRNDAWRDQVVQMIYSTMRQQVLPMIFVLCLTLDMTPV